MNMKDTIDILVPQQTIDNKGIVHNQYIKNMSIPCNWQPLKYNVQFKPFGVNDKTSDVIFCHDYTITADMRIGFNNKQYIIDSILQYRKHVEIYVEKVS